ncbi:MAG: TIGR02466 family protein [Sphingomicrobium sp.]
MATTPASGRRLLRLFATPVLVEELADAAELNAALEATILARMQSDPGVKLSNIGGWQSHHNLTAWSGDAGQRVLRAAAALATANTRVIQRGGIGWSIDAWANVSDGGASNRAHVHGGSFWSAVYYVRVGAGEGGELMLHDPRMPGLRMHAPNLRFKDGGPEVVAPIKPRAGLLILFPAWLSHSVQPWDGGEARISIAMNIRAAAAAAPEAPAARPRKIAKTKAD